MERGNLLKTASMLVAVSMLLAACQFSLPLGNLIPSQKGTATAVAAQTESALETATAFQPEPATPTPPEPTSTPTPTLTPTPSVEPSGPTNFPDNVDPLTGLRVSDPSILNRRPVFVKVSNFPRDGRPHAGLSSADIVFEYYIGEGTNRFIALYYGQNSSKVGPIRSGRLIDAQLVPMYQGILAMESAYVTVYNAILNALGRRVIIGGPSTCPAICDDGRHTVTSVFADTAALTQLATARGVDNTKPNLDGMRFDPQVPSGGTPATDITVEYNIQDKGEWRYDAASGAYLRWIESVDNNGNVTMVPLTDRNTEKQLSFNNVVILFAFYNELAPTLHQVNLNNNPNGARAILFRDGQAFEGIWKSVGTDKPIQLFTKDGQPLPFKPGNSWMVIMGTNTTVNTSGPAWTFHFYLP